MSDKELLYQLKNGDEQAYKTIFDNYYSLLVAFARKYLHDIDLAKEVVQNDFVKLYDSKKRITQLQSYY